MKINNQAEYLIFKAELNKPIRLLNGVDYKKMEDALLEYRRQNNIYEVGDYVLFPIACEKGGKYFGKIIDYRSDINQFDVLGSRHWGWFTSSELQHANDAEIEANRRLDLPQVSSIIKANFKNAAGEDIQVIGKVRELKGRTICCDELGTGKPFFCLPSEFKKYDLPESVILSLGEVS